MNWPQVEITEVTIETVENRLVGLDGVPIRVDLGDDRTTAVFNQLLQVFRTVPHRTFLLRWSGGKIPRGAVVAGHSITWTQHGIVSAEERMVGTYDRLVECGGKDGLDQAMLVHVRI